MTEKEWLTCDEPRPMLEFLRGKLSDRKMRLLGVAFCRRMWKLIPTGACRAAVWVAERYSDGQATDKDRRDGRNRITARPSSAPLAVINAQGAVLYLNEKTAGKSSIFVTSAAAIAHAASDKYQTREKSYRIYRAAYRAAQRAEVRLIRCVVGNPFRPLHVERTCLKRGGEPLRGLAETLYEKRLLPEGHFAPRRVDELADALEAAGCTEETIVSHLRGPGPHVRGCFVVDLLLDRK